MTTANGILPKLVDALAFAAHAHRAQRRKDAGATPYINHPLGLVRILAVEAGVEDIDILCAAALHDYIEDCCGGEEQPTVDHGTALLRDRFGERVTEYVAAVSDDKSLGKNERKRMQIEHAANIPTGAKLVKLADKIANLRDIADAPPMGWSLQRRLEYFDWATRVVDQIRGTHPGLETLFDIAASRRPSAT